MGLPSSICLSTQGQRFLLEAIFPVARGDCDRVYGVKLRQLGKHSESLTRIPTSPLFKRMALK